MKGRMAAQCAIVRQTLVAAALVLSALAASCATTPRSGQGAEACASSGAQQVVDDRIFKVDRRSCDLSEFAIAVREEGRFQSLYADGEIGAASAIDPIIARLKREQRRKRAAGEPLRILIYAHGGMVQKDAAIDHADDLAPAMLRDGFEPVFLIWESGFVSSYRDRLCCVRDGKKDTSWRLIALPFRLVGDIGASAARAPQTFGSQGLRYWRSASGDTDTEYYLESEPREERIEACKNLSGTRCPTVILPAVGPDDMNGERPEALLLSPLYLSLFPVRTIETILGPEVGAAAWDNMVRRTRTAFQRSAVAATRDDGKCISSDDPEHEGGFAIFFERLACEIATGQLDSVELHFYGHSMGSLVGNEAIAAYPDLPWRNVVYMAAATTVRDFRFSAAPILEKDARIAFYNLTLHPLNEARESFGFGIAPSGSLLEWIDEMFERPRSVDERTLGKWSNVKDTLHLFPEGVRERMTVRVFAAQKKFHGSECDSGASRCHPTRHGEFDDFSFWRSAYLTGTLPSAASSP